MFVPVVLLSFLVLCSGCNQAPNRSEFERQVAEIAREQPTGSIHILIQIGNKYCELMSSGQFRVDSQGSFSTPAMVKAREIAQMNQFSSPADGVALVDATAKYAQKYLCP